jgi:hypothetical protein
MNHEVQSWLALAIVVATIGVFVSRLFRKKKVGGCPSCGGGGKTTMKVKAKQA